MNATLDPAELVNEKRLQKDFDSLRELSKDTSGGVTRLAYTETETKAHEYVALEAKKIGLTATTDAIGNLYIKLGNSNGDIIRIGSHLDSVNNGGNYDGAVGVLTSLEALRCLVQANARLSHPVELVVFRVEESTRFNRGCIASEIMTGRLTKKEAKELKDKGGVTLYDAIKSCGFNPEKLTTTVWDRSTVKIFLEPHIEQGKVLENEAVPIGIVTGIAAPVRYIVSVEGVTGHSGATPMNMRKDAVAASADMILAAERVGKETFKNGKPTLVTVGNIIVAEGSINKIAGKATFYLDIRDIKLEDRNRAEKEILQEFKKIAKIRSVILKVEETQRAIPAVLNDDVCKMLTAACEKLGVKNRGIISGAAQDSMHISNYGIPTGMIFVPSKNGISHAPEEFTEISHITLATKVLIEALMEADNT